MGHFSVFDMFNTCVEDLDSEELDSCIPVDEQPLARRALSMIDKAVCSKAKRKFPKGPPTIPTTFSYPPSQGYISYNVAINANTSSLQNLTP